MTSTGPTPPQLDVLQILRARAQALARPPESELAPQASVEVLEFRLRDLKKRAPNFKLGKG